MKAFRALVLDEQRLLELEVIGNDTARTLLTTRVSEPARELLNSSVQLWVERHMSTMPGWPAEWRRCLDEGWVTAGHGNDRVTLYQAWALHFREAIKHKQAVFNVFAAGELADGIPVAVCSHIDHTLRVALDGQTEQLLLSL